MQTKKPNIQGWLKKASPRLRAPASWLPLPAGASSRNLIWIKTVQGRTNYNASTGIFDLSYEFHRK